MAHCGEWELVLRPIRPSGWYAYLVREPSGWAVEVTRDEADWIKQAHGTDEFNERCRTVFRRKSMTAH